MLSEVQRDYVKSIYNANCREYPYYLAYSDTYIGSGYADYNNPDLVVILSKEPIIANSKYNYTIPSNSLKYSVITRNASNQYHSERVVTSQINGDVSVDNYEFVYTNAEFTGISLQPDLFYNEVRQDVFNGVSIALLIVLSTILFIKIVKG